VGLRAQLLPRALLGPGVSWGSADPHVGHGTPRCPTAGTWAPHKPVSLVFAWVWKSLDLLP